MKRTLLLALALIAVGCTGVGQSALCEGLSVEAPLEDLRRCAEQGDTDAPFILGSMYNTGDGVPEDRAHAMSRDSCRTRSFTQVVGTPCTCSACRTEEI